MKRSHSYILLVLIAAALTTPVRADVGQTHQLKRERAELLEQMNTFRLSKDDTIVTYIDALNQKLVGLDEQLFNSYQQTVDRMVEQKGHRSMNDRLLVALAMITTAISIILSILIMMARNRVVEKENMGLRGVYRQLSADFMQKVSPDKAGNGGLLRVNVGVILGLVMMSVSILAFLISSL